MISLKLLYKSLTRRMSKIDKRIRLVLSSLLLTFAVLIATFFQIENAIYFIPLLIFLSYVCTIFTLSEDIENIGWFSFFFMPIMLTITFYLEYYLVPGRWLTRLPFIVMYGISIYAILLTSNIFNVGVEKSLQLYRAAFSVNYFYHAIVLFMGLNFIFSMQMNSFINAFLVGGLGFLYGFQLLWSIRLKKYIEIDVLKYAAFIALILGQVALCVSFIPLKPISSSLLISISYYSFVGLVYHFLDERLFKETIREYLFVWIFVLLITLFSMSW